MFRLISLLFILTSCSYSVTMTHTEGEATDVVDQSQTPSTTLSASLDKLLRP